MATTKEDIASQALARLGEPPIADFNEDTETAEKVSILYEPTVLQVLSSYDWAFATRRAELSIDENATPINEWKYAYTMPAGRSVRVGKPLSVFASTSLRAPQVFQFEVQEKWIFTNYEKLVIEYIHRTDEDDWPGYFQTLTVEALAAVFALPVTENASKEQLHRQIAYGNPSEGNRGGLFQTAAEADAQGEPTKSLLDDHDPIWNARFGGVR